MVEKITNIQAQPTDALPMGVKPAPFDAVKKAIKELTLREKVLISALIVAAIVTVLALFVLIPASDRLSAAESELDTLRIEEANTQMTIAGRPSSESMLEDAQGRYAQYILMYQAPMLPEDLDRMVTSLLEDCGFTAASLALSPSSVEDVPGFAPAAPAWEIPNPAAPVVETPPQEGAEGELALDADGTAGTEGEAGVEGATTPEDAANAEDAAATEESAGGSGIENLPPAAGSAGSSASGSTGAGAQAQVFNVQVSAVGYESSFYDLLDRVAAVPWITITTTTFTPPKDYVSLDQSFAITFKIYVHPSATVKSL